MMITERNNYYNFNKNNQHKKKIISSKNKQNKNVVCKFFLTPNGCKFGDSCLFLHSKKTTKANTTTTTKKNTKKVVRQPNYKTKFANQLTRSEQEEHRFGQKKRKASFSQKQLVGSPPLKKQRSAKIRKAIQELKQSRKESIENSKKNKKNLVIKKNVGQRKRLTESGNKNISSKCLVGDTKQVITSDVTLESQKKKKLSLERKQSILDKKKIILERKKKIILERMKKSNEDKEINSNANVDRNCNDKDKESIKDDCKDLKEKNSKSNTNEKRKDLERYFLESFKFVDCVPFFRTTSSSIFKKRRANVIVNKRRALSGCSVVDENVELDL